MEEEFICPVCFLQHHEEQFGYYYDYYCSSLCQERWASEMSNQQQDAHKDTYYREGDRTDKKRKHFENRYPKLPRFWGPSPSSPSSPSPCLSSSSSLSALSSSATQELEEENSKLQEQLQIMKKEAIALKDSYCDFQARLTKLEDDKVSLQRKVKTLQNEKIEFEKNHQQIHRKLDTLQNENTQLEQNLQQSQNTITQLRNEISVLQPRGQEPVQKPFNQTTYYELYNLTPPPQFQFDVFTAVRTFLSTFQKQNHRTISEKIVNQFIRQLQQETLVLGGVDEFLNEVETIAIRLWTSPQKLQNRELCSIFNQAIRSDNKEMMPSVVVFARGLNMLCVNRRVSSLPEGPRITFRGGGLPSKEIHDFFAVGKQFRSPQFLSTSISRGVAFDFVHRAVGRGEIPVLWEFHFDEDYRCKHVNILSKSNVEGEKEFLFAAYSVFTVRVKEIQVNPTWKNPHKIALDVAPDNQDYPENLPVSPWS